MAVDDRASAPPTTRAASADSASQCAVRPTASEVKATCAKPRRSMWRHIARNRWSGRSSPTAKSRKMTPNSASPETSSVARTSPRPEGPTRTRPRDSPARD